MTLTGGRTPARVDAAADPWERVVAAVTALERTDLRPGRVVDALFGVLVEGALALPADHPGIAAEGPRVRALCATGEGRLESWWAERVAADPAALARFPYLANYAELVPGEWSALTAALGRRPERVAFVGSGPLPLTAVLLHRLAPGVRITCVDRDAGALAHGRAVADALGCDLTFLRAQAVDVDTAGVDAVVLAALVGESESARREVVAALAASAGPQTVVAVRSVPADGRRLLYPRFRSAHVPPGWRVRGEWQPPPGVVNSLVLLGREGAGER